MGPVVTVITRSQGPLTRPNILSESTRNGHNYNKNNNYKFTETTQLLNQENHNNPDIKGSRVIPEMIDKEVKVKDRSEVHFFTWC